MLTRLLSLAILILADSFVAASTNPPGEQQKSSLINDDQPSLASSSSSSTPTTSGSTSIVTSPSSSPSHSPAVSPKNRPPTPRGKRSKDTVPKLRISIVNASDEQKGKKSSSSSPSDPVKPSTERNKRRPSRASVLEPVKRRKSVSSTTANQSSSIHSSSPSSAPSYSQASTSSPSASLANSSNARSQKKSSGKTRRANSMIVATKKRSIKANSSTGKETPENILKHAALDISAFIDRTLALVEVGKRIAPKPSHFQHFLFMILNFRFMVMEYERLLPHHSFSSSTSSSSLPSSTTARAVSPDRQAFRQSASMLDEMFGSASSGTAAIEDDDRKDGAGTVTWIMLAPVFTNALKAVQESAIIEMRHPKVSMHAIQSAFEAVRKVAENLLTWLMANNEKGDVDVERLKAEMDRLRASLDTLKGRYFKARLEKAKQSDDYVKTSMQALQLQGLHLMTALQQALLQDMQYCLNIDLLEDIIRVSDALVRPQAYEPSDPAFPRVDLDVLMEMRDDVYVLRQLCKASPNH